MSDREEPSDAYREFTREIILRFERAMRSVSADFERGMRSLSADIREDIRQHREESRRYFEALDRKLDAQSRQIDDVIDENRAQRGALLRMLDRLDNGGAAPAG